MGVLLSKPNVEKEFEDGGNEKLQFACCSMQVTGPTCSETLEHASKLYAIIEIIVLIKFLTSRAYATRRDGGRPWKMLIQLS